MWWLIFGDFTAGGNLIYKCFKEQNDEYFSNSHKNTNICLLFGLQYFGMKLGGEIMFSYGPFINNPSNKVSVAHHFVYEIPWMG